MPSTAQIIDYQPSRMVQTRPVLEPDSWRDMKFNDIGEVCRFLSAEIFASKMKFSKLAALSNCHATTISHLAHGQTSSPRFATVLQVLRALGMELVIRG